jgi:hypothetical protein
VDPRDEAGGRLSRVRPAGFPIGHDRCGGDQSCRRGPTRGPVDNWGAAVSVLAFIGSLATKELVAVSQLSRVASSLVVFAYGVAAAVMGLGLSYLTHFFEAVSIASLKRTAEFPFMTPTKASKRNLWFRGSAHVLAVIAFFVCIGCFIFGMISVRDAIVHLAH